MKTALISALLLVVVFASAGHASDPFPDSLRGLEALGVKPDSIEARDIFVPKKERNPFGLVMHFTEAFVVTMLGSEYGGDEGAAYAGAGVIAAGFLWEVSNGLFDRGGDPIDFLAFPAGAMIAAVFISLRLR